jgi:hypothetical protein
MTERRPVGWMAGLLGLAVAAATTAVVLTWLSSDLQIQANRFWSSQQEPAPQELYEYWDRISMNSYTMMTLVTPLLLGAMAAVLALLAVLAFRWEQRRAPARQVAEAATAAGSGAAD